MPDIQDSGGPTSDHCGGIPLGCAGLCSECTSEHQREKAERHFVPESEERHVVSLNGRAL